MQLRAEALATLDDTRKFFDRTTSVLTEADSNFRSTPETMTVASMVAHVAQTLDWFRDGAFRGDWRLDFEALTAETDAVTSLAEARRWLARAFAELRTTVEAATDADLAAELLENLILPGRPRYNAIQAIVDHTAHHRGALAVYARLLCRVPPMPYVES
jgi:uncharacterized damage-inducible protein DinB